MLCCAQYSLDDEWYRGKVISVKTAENAATNEIVGADVLFVDYGTFETVPLTRYVYSAERYRQYGVEYAHEKLFYF